MEKEKEKDEKDGEAVENEVLPPKEIPLPEEETPPEQAVDYAALAASDLKAIKTLCRDFEAVETLAELPFARRFAELRDLGLSVEEALAAAMPRRYEENGKAHLRSAVPRPSYIPSDSLSHEEMKAAKDLFYGLSEKEINALYRRVKR